jgi:hypothetical protein
MALAFTQTKGKAVKNSYESYQYKDGENTVRIVGGILPRYVYWLKGTNNKDIPVECLAFDREKEKFTNAEVDHVPAFFPDKKCSWSYSVNALVDGKVVVLNLKKKLFEQICSAAEDLGDPTDTKEGWDVVFKRQKTGPLPFNVEYTLSVLRCKKRALTAAELAAVEESVTIDQKFIRATAEEVKATLERITTGAEEEVVDSTADQEAINDIAH